MNPPVLPPAGSNDWYAHYSGLDATARDHETRLAAAEAAAADDVTGIGITTVQKITQAAYDALSAKADTTLYVIQG